MKHSRPAFLMLLAFVLIFASCARTKLVTFTDPDYRNAGRFNSVIVFAFGVGLEERQTIETTATENFKKRGIRALRGMDLVPPTRNVSKKKRALLIASSGVATMLVIAAAGKDILKSYVPPTYYPGSVTGTATTMGNTTYVQMRQSPGYTTGGYTISKPVAGYVVALIDAKNGRAIWRGDADSKGSAFDNFNSLGRSVAETTVQRLIEDGLF